MFETMKAKVLGAGLGLALVGSAVGGVVTTGITAAGAQTPSATPVTQSQQSQTPETVEANDAAETVDPNEPAGGHEDAPGTDVQHDFQGVE